MLLELIEGNPLLFIPDEHFDYVVGDIWIFVYIFGEYVIVQLFEIFTFKRVAPFEEVVSADA